MYLRHFELIRLRPRFALQVADTQNPTLRRACMVPGYCTIVSEGSVSLREARVKVGKGRMMCVIALRAVNQMS